jgi:hypothetical protein
MAYVWHKPFESPIVMIGDRYMVYIPKVIEAHKILICAIGGGFDIFGAIPIMESLSDKELILSSFSLNRLEGAIFDMREPIGGFEYFPENIFIMGGGSLNVVGKCGVMELREYYKELIDRHEIEYIITVDCGVDSLMVGDERYMGTILEECVNLAALKDFGIPMMHICVGMGTEVEERISTKVVMENIRELMKSGYYYGVSGLVKGESSYESYKERYMVVNKIDGHKKSHIHPRIIGSVEGMEYVRGDKTLMESSEGVLVEPIMSLYWFFDGMGVIGRNRIIPMIEGDRTWGESVRRIRGIVGTRE